MSYRVVSCITDYSPPSPFPSPFPFPAALATVHGNVNEMTRLKDRLDRDIRTPGYWPSASLAARPRVSMPDNTNINGSWAGEWELCVCAVLVVLLLNNPYEVVIMFTVQLQLHRRHRRRFCNQPSA